MAAWLLALGIVAAGAPQAGAQTPLPTANPSTPQTTNGPQSDARRAQTYVEQAARLQQEGRLDLALKTLDDGLKIAPRDPRLRFMYGVILNQQKRYGEAIDVFQQLSEDYPELPEPYNNLAVLYAQRGDLDQARASLERAIRALPGYALANENLGDVYVRLAVRSYAQAGKLDPRGDGHRKLRLAEALLSKIAESPSGARRGDAADMDSANTPSATPTRPLRSSIDGQPEAASSAHPSAPPAATGESAQPPRPADPTSTYLQN